MTQAIDHRRLLAEIDAEVRRLREGGELPPDFEQALDRAFARFAPAQPTGDDFDRVLAWAEQSTFVDAMAPVDSSRPLVPQVKRLIRKATGWELRYVAQQVSAFAHAVTKALRLLADRVDALELASPGVDQGERGVGDARALAPALDAGAWAPVVVDALRPVTGRVVHAECGDGQLLARLVAEGIDAYGVAPSAAAWPAALDVRVEKAHDHLAALPDGSLGGVVLSGCVDRLPAAVLARLARLAVAKLGPAGVVVVLGTDPRVWGRGHSAVAADLAPGRPLRAETWAHLLATQGLASPTVVAGAPAGGLRPVPGADPELDQNIERLNEVLFPPAGYAVVARRLR